MKFYSVFTAHLFSEERKSQEVMRRELDALKKKAKTMETHLKTALSELQAFQLKKQQRLNELDQIVVLQLHQLLYCQRGGAPPTNVSPCLVLPASAQVRLTQRIGELAVEKNQEKKRYRLALSRGVNLAH